MKWAVEIQKTNLPERNLRDLLSALGFALIEGIDYKAVTSDQINACNDASEVNVIAINLKTAFATAQVDPEIIFGAVLDFTQNPPGRHHFVQGASCIQFGIATATAIDLGPPHGSTDSQILKWEEEQKEAMYQARLLKQKSVLIPAFHDKRASKAIELLAVKSPSGEQVYKMYELAEGHPDNRKCFQNEFGISKETFDRFRDAVHSPSVSGDWARHAYDNDHLNSSNPMTTAEATLFATDVVRKWLEKLCSSHQQ